MLMESEVKELYDYQFIDKQLYLQAMMILRSEQKDGTIKK